MASSTLAASVRLPSSSRPAARANSASKSAVISTLPTSALRADAARARTSARATCRFTGRETGGGALHSEGVGPAVGQNANELLVEEVARRSDICGNAFVVHLPAAFDVLSEPLVEVAVLAPLDHGARVVELDLRDEQPREPASLLTPRVAQRL